AVEERPAQRRRAAADVEHAPRGDAGEVGEKRREARAPTAHEAIIPGRIRVARHGCLSQGEEEVRRAYLTCDDKLSPSICPRGGRFRLRPRRLVIPYLVVHAWESHRIEGT